MSPRLGSTTAPWILLDEAGDPATPWPGDLASRLVRTDPALAAELADVGLLTASLATHGSARAAIVEAERLIACIPSLHATLVRCVHEIHLLHVEDDAYDVSHSEPRWRTRIFVSCPRPSEVSGLREAEAIVHEGMHLNLTNLEAVQPVVVDDAPLYSPWRSRPRPASGVLHGYYVFRCVAGLMDALATRGELTARQREFARRRVEEISDEVAQVEVDVLKAVLTPRGKTLVEACAEFFRHAPDGSGDVR